MASQPPLEVRVRSANAFRKRRPEVARAWNKVQRAVKSGVLVRPAACQRCGRFGPVEASHDDYDQPLRVEWLCRSCHIEKDRPEHCPRGHEYSPANTYVRPRGTRECRACNRLRRRGEV